MLKSLELTYKLSSLDHPEDLFLIFLDVKCLFRSISPKDCIKMISDLLFQNSDLIHKNNLILLTKFVLKQNFFSFSNKSFIQTPELVMGFSLSPVLA